MSVKIGHARIDENGRATGGESGDQNSKEIRIQNWYDGGWAFLARPKNPVAAEYIAAACEAGCANENLGYDQTGRNTGLQEAKKVNWDLSKILNPSEFDCSSFVTCCILAGGIQIWSGGNAPTTRTLRKVLEQSGEFQILTDEKYLTGPDYVMRGDTLCKPDSHTVIVLTDGDKARETIDEAADEEASEGPKNEIRSGVTYSIVLPLVQTGDSGPIVAALQVLLTLHGVVAPEEEWAVDGIYGPKTKEAVKEVQRRAGKTKDGIVGGETWPVLLNIE